MELSVYFEFQTKPGLSEHDSFEEEFSHIQLADELGFDVAWLAELHFSPERSILASPFLVACAAAHRTRRIKVGTGVAVLPLNNPVRIAEEVATIDHITNGRFELGIGRSGTPRAYIGYNTPYAESRGRFRECLEIMLKAWTQERFSYCGQYYQFEDVCVVPKPYQKPYPPIRNAATSAGTFTFSGEMGFPIFIGLRGVLESTRQRIQSYKDAWRKAEHPGEPSVCARVPLYIAETQPQAEAEMEKSAMNFYRKYVPQQSEPLPGLSDEENADRAARSQRLQNMTYEEFLKTDGVVGTPESAAEKLMEMQESYGLTGFMVEANFGGLLPREKVHKSLRLFMEKVVPKLG